MAKKEKLELPKTVTITPTENTHFRVILSSEAMETEGQQAEGQQAVVDPVCAIVKPEPRSPLSPPASTPPTPPPTPASPLTPLTDLPAAVATSTPTEPTPASPAAVTHIPGDTGDACADAKPCSKTDSPSKKKGRAGARHEAVVALV